MNVRHRAIQHWITRHPVGALLIQTGALHLALLALLLTAIYLNHHTALIIARR